MATTCTVSTNLSASGTASIAGETHTKTTTLSGTSDVVAETQDVGTSSEALTFGEIAAGGAEFIELVNLDTTNFVSVSFENPAVAGTKTFKIKAGQSGVFPTPSGALYAIADTAVVKVLKKAVEA